MHRTAHQVRNSDQPNQSPNYTPAVIRMRAGEHELWRAAADTIIDLQLQYDGVAQPLQLSVAGFYDHNIAKPASDTYADRMSGTKLPTMDETRWLMGFTRSPG